MSFLSSICLSSIPLELIHDPFNPFSHVKVSAPGKGKRAKPSPATGPRIPASFGRGTTPGGSGIQTSPLRPTTSAPQPEALEQTKPVLISSDPTLERDAGAGRGADGDGEVESQPPKLDLAALTHNRRGKFVPSNSDGAIGTGSSAPTYFRKKSYTLLSECEKWHLADDCVEILMQWVWGDPHEQFDAMKKAIEEFLMKHKLTLVVSSYPVAPKYHV